MKWKFTDMTLQSIFWNFEISRKISFATWTHPTPLPWTWGVEKITFQCIFEHFIQFLIKIFFCNITPPHIYGECSLEKITFLCRSGHFIQFLAKKKSFLQLDLPTHFQLHWKEGCQTWLSVQIWISHANPSKKYSLFELESHPTTTTMAMEGKKRWHFYAHLDISFNSW